MAVDGVLSGEHSFSCTDSQELHCSPTWTG